MKMEYLEGIGTQRNFPTIFRQLSDNFPKNESKSKGAPPELKPTSWFDEQSIHHSPVYNKVYVVSNVFPFCATGLTGISRNFRVEVVQGRAQVFCNMQC